MPTYRFLIGIIVLAYLAASIFSSFSMFTMKHHHQPISNCPLMLGETGLCGMNISEHLWWLHMKTVGILPPAFALVFFLFSTYAFLFFRRSWRPPDSFCLQRLADAPYAFPYPLLLAGSISPRAP